MARDHAATRHVRFLMAAAMCSACATGSRILDRTGDTGAGDASVTGGAGGTSASGGTTAGSGASAGAGPGGFGGDAGASGGATAGAGGGASGAPPNAGSGGGAGSGSGGAAAASGAAGTPGAGGAGDSGSDPCAGVSCTSPPANRCAGASLEVFTSPGVCAGGVCGYSSAVVPCPSGCSSGACTGDPCIGVACTSPPAAACADASNLRVHDSPGTCSGGSCQYGQRLVPCPFGCSGAACRACSLDTDCAAGRWCNGGTCSPCNVDARCGPSCTDCTAAGNFCNAAGTLCVACRVTGDCAAGSQCSSGTCLPCRSDGACGASCAPCGGGTPKCLDQGASATCVQCLGDADCGGGATCNLTTHACDSGTCPLPPLSCNTGAENRIGCANARTIGRLAASSMSGFTASPTTCSASNSSDAASCADAGSDHTYRIYLRAGESITVTATTAASCGGSTWFGTLKVLGTQGCASAGCGAVATCSASKQSHSVNHTATADGWHFVVMDGSSGSDSGTYSLGVRLTCLAGGCGC